MYDPTHNTNDYTSPMSAAQAAAAYDVESRFSMKDLLRIFWRRLWIVVMVVLIAVGTAIGASLAQEPVYEASTKLLLGQEPSKDAAVANLMGSVEGLQQLTHTVATAVDSRPVAQEAIQRNALQMDSQDLLNNLSVTQIEDTQFLLLSYRDTDPQRARDIVDSVSEVSSQQISEANATRDDITITVWEFAALPTSPVSPNPVRNGLLALGLGLMLGMGLAFLMEYLDDRWRSAEEVERVSGVPTFGVIPQFEVEKKRRKKQRKLEDV